MGFSGRPLLLVPLALALGCPEPVAGQCKGEGGHLCITAAGEPLAPPGETHYQAEVRVGADCGSLKDLESAASGPDRFRNACRPRKDLGCKRSLAPDLRRGLACPGGEAGRPGCLLPARFAAAREFTLDVDLSDETDRSGEVLLTVVDKDGRCLEHGRQPLPAAPDPGAPYSLSVPLSQAACASFHRPCSTDAGCTPANRACQEGRDCDLDRPRLCCNGLCVDPPEPPPSMTFVPGGTTVLGSTDSAATPEEQPCPMLRKVPLQPFYIDVHETSVAEFGRFCGATGKCDAARLHLSPASYPDGGPYCTYPGYPDRSANCLVQSLAQEYCQWRLGKDARVPGSLPSEAEWDWVATSGLGARPRYPFSSSANEPAPSSCGGINAYLGPGFTPCEAAGAMHPPVRASAGRAQPQTPEDMSPPGLLWPRPALYDLAGNLSEWTTAAVNHLKTGSGFDSYCVDKTVGELRIVRGGNWHSPPSQLTTFKRLPVSSDETRDQGADFLFDKIGVRCVLRLNR